MATTPAIPTTQSTVGHPCVIAFMNQKGGVGKTTTVVNVAAALALSGQRILVIDMDPQAHATLHLGHDPASLQGSIYDALSDPTLIDGAVIESRPNLWLLPSEVDLAGAEIELASADDRHGRLKRAIAGIADRFDLILIDCPPSLGILTLNALAVADTVIVPMQAHFLALQGVSKLLETVQLMAVQVNPGLTIAGVALCMHDEQTTHGKEVVADLESFFAQAKNGQTPWARGCVFRPGIRRNIKLAESPSFGQTIFEYAPTAPGAKDYTELAQVIQRFVSETFGAKSAAAPTAAPVEKPEAEIVVQTTDASKAGIASP